VKLFLILVLHLRQFFIVRILWKGLQVFKYFKGFGMTNNRVYNDAFRTFTFSMQQSVSFTSEFLKFIGPREQKIMRSANNVGPHVRQAFLNDVFTFLTEVGNAGLFVNTRTSLVNSFMIDTLPCCRNCKQNSK
jgi:hypothetical protein